jgi:enoyl-CoA hydratase/carnithine racemase
MSPGSPAARECLTLVFDGPVATLTLRHRPMNAIDDALLDELASIFNAVTARAEISALPRQIFYG